MKEQIKSVTVLVAICAVVAVLMAITNSITAPIIAENEATAASEALLEVLPDGKNFVEIDLGGYTLPATVKEAFREDGGGVVVKLETAGYSSGMIIMCGVKADGTVSGALCLSSTETLGYEKTYGESLIGANQSSIDSIDTISGATKTTAAYRAAVKDAINASIIFGGGSVDIRTEEEILYDNLALVLLAGDGKFTEEFVTEELDGVDAVYSADNGQGLVFICGDSFYVIDKDGKAVSALTDGTVYSNIPDDKKASLEASAAKLMSATVTELDLKAYEGLPEQLLKASVTSGGNYVVEMRGAGFGINGDEWYNPSGEYIVVRLAITPDGKIISCLTVSQKETDGIGSVCAVRSFYSQFNGKDASTYKNIDAISGATLTTNGYTTAVGRALEAVKILKGDQ